MFTSVKTFTGVILSIFLFFSGAMPSFAKNPDNAFYNNLKLIYQSSKSYEEYKDIDILFSPSLKRADRKKYLSEIHRSIGFWSKKDNLGMINIIIWDPRDLSWANKKHYSITKDWGRSANALSDDVMWVNGKPTCYQSGTGARYEENLISHTATICHDKKRTAWSSHVISHEITHMWQMSVIAAERVILVPVWLSEGSATYYGLGLNGINQKNAQKNIKKMYSLHTKYTKSGRALFSQLKNNPLKLKDFVHKASSTDLVQYKRMADASYYYGSLIVNELIEKYGHEKFIEYYKSFNVESDYKKNFEKVFGLTIDSFCDKIAQEVIGYFR